MKLYPILDVVMNKYINAKFDGIDKTYHLKRSLKQVIHFYNDIGDCSFEIHNAYNLIIGIENEVSYFRNQDLYSEMSYKDVFHNKLIGEHPYYFTFMFRDFLYPSVVYRTNQRGSIWIKNNSIHFYCDTYRNSLKFGLFSEYCIDINEITKEDLFGMRLVVNFNFEDDMIFDAIRCYKLLKKERKNILFDIRERMA